MNTKASQRCGVDIFTAFAVVPRDSAWVMREGVVLVWDLENCPVEDFVIGTFSSVDLAEVGVVEFLKSYRPGHESMLDKVGHMAPVIEVFLWRTQLDEGGGQGEMWRTVIRRGELRYGVE